MLSFVFSSLHALGGGAPDKGFGVVTTFGDKFGTEAGVGGTEPIYSASLSTVSGQQDYDLQDLIYSALNRFSSVSVAVIFSSCAIYIMQHFLNRFSVRCHHTFE